MTPDKPSADGLMALVYRLEDSIIERETHKPRRPADDAYKAVRAYAERLAAQPQNESPFDAFRDLAGRLGWDAEREHAGGLFCDAALQATWDRLSRSTSPQPQGEPDSVDLAIALEQQRALKIVEDVHNLRIGGRNETMPTAYQAGHCNACEEIEHRLRTEQWELNGSPAPLPSAPPQPAQPRASQPEPMSDKQITALFRSKSVMDALLAYHARPCDPEAAAIVRAILTSAPQEPQERGVDGMALPDGGQQK
jgi:hypothetical protein